MILGRRLREPDVTCVPGELAALARRRDRVAIADLPAGRVHEIGAALHAADHLGVEEMLGLGMQRRVDRDDVADRDELLGRLVVGDAELLLDLGRQPVAVRVVEADLERFQAAQHRRADAARADRADLHALEVVRARDGVRDVPAAVEHDPVRGQVVADERQDHHHDVLGDADRVRVGDLGDRDLVVDRRLEVDVVGPDPGGHGELEVRCLGDPLRGQVGRPERLRDDDLGVRELALEGGVGPVLVGRDDQLVATALDEAPEPELARDAAEQLAGREVDRLWRRGRLAAVVAGDLGDAVARVLRRVAVDGIVVEDAEDLRHGAILAGARRGCGLKRL